MNNLEIRLNLEIKFFTIAVHTTRSQLSSGAINANRFYVHFVCYNIKNIVMRWRYLLMMRLFKKVNTLLTLTKKLSKSFPKIKKFLKIFHPRKLKFVLNKFRKHLKMLLSLLQFK